MSIASGNRFFLLLCLLFGLVLCVTQPSFAQSSANYRIWTDVIAGGGGETASTNYRSHSTLGQSSPLGFFNSTGYSNYSGFIYSLEGIPIVSVVGVYDNGVWYLDLNGNREWDATPTDGLYYFGGGLSGAVPVTGDWTGTGVTRIGIYDNGVWYLDLNGNGMWDGMPTDGLHYFGGGLTGAVPITGDWTGTGITKIGLYDKGVWYLDLNGNGMWDGTPADGLFYFGGGLPGAVPVTGNWTGTSTTKIGVYHNGIWYLDLNGNGIWDGTPTDGLYYFGGGLTGAIPVTGDWTGTGTTKIGVYWDGIWYLDLNGNGIWDGTPTDGLYYFGGGLAGAVPIVSK